MRRFSEQMGWAADRGGFAIEAAVDERLGFLRKTYSLLTVQIAAVGALSAAILSNEELTTRIATAIWGTRYGMFVYLGAVFAISLVTRRMLEGNRPLGVQYGAAALCGALWMGSIGLLAIGMIAFFMGAGGSIWYSVAWLVLLSGWTLYDTSQVLHKRAVNQYVAASVDLLVDFVYMFIYILMILMRSRD